MKFKIGDYFLFISDRVLEIGQVYKIEWDEDQNDYVIYYKRKGFRLLGEPKYYDKKLHFTKGSPFYENSIIYKSLDDVMVELL